MESEGPDPTSSSSSTEIITNNPWDNIIALRVTVPQFLMRIIDDKPTTCNRVRVRDDVYIRPSAFNASPAPSRDIRQIDLRTIRNNLEAQLGFRENFSTLFSSWTQDLGYLARFIDNTDDSACFAVFDKGGPQGPILPADGLCETFNIESDHPKEYLMYGTITEYDYVAVPLKWLVDAGLNDFLNPAKGVPWQEMMPLAKSLGRMFGHYFEPAMTVMFIAQYCDQHTDYLEVRRAMAGTTVPKQWRGCLTLQGVSLDAQGSESCERAYRIFEELIKKPIKKPRVQLDVDDSAVRATGAASSSARPRSQRRRSSSQGGRSSSQRRPSNSQGEGSGSHGRRPSQRHAERPSGSCGCCVIL